MKTNAAGQSFELRRFPNLRNPVVKMWCMFLVAIALQHWLLKDEKHLAAMEPSLPDTGNLAG